MQTVKRSARVPDQALANLALQVRKDLPMPRKNDLFLFHCTVCVQSIQWTQWTSDLCSFLGLGVLAQRKEQ